VLQKQTTNGAFERVLRAIQTGLLGDVAVTFRPKQALAYVRICDEEELSDAERRAAIIRERMRRQGFWR
jgi:hypothetical protein